MRGKGLVLSASCLVLSAVAFGGEASMLPAGKNFKLVWSDEF